MSDPYLGEIRLMAGFWPGTRQPPANWMLCDGSLLQIADGNNTALYSLIGTTYGGDGSSTFALPDLRGRVPVNYGSGTGNNPAYELGQQFGAESVTLTDATMPSHSHSMSVTSAAATTMTPDTTMTLGAVNPNYLYAPKPAVTNGAVFLLNPGTLAPEGNSAAHENRQPSMAMYYIICVQGFYPSRS
jgi:microcystin-dependent protein